MVGAAQCLVNGGDHLLVLDLDRVFERHLESFLLQHQHQLVERDQLGQKRFGSVAIGLLVVDNAQVQLLDLDDFLQALFLDLFEPGVFEVEIRLFGVLLAKEVANLFFLEFFPGVVLPLGLGALVDNGLNESLDVNKALLREPVLGSERELVNLHEHRDERFEDSFQLLGVYGVDRFVVEVLFENRKNFALNPRVEVHFGLW